jgi:undecaprenyl-diphosphatase
VLPAVVLGALLAATIRLATRPDPGAANAELFLRINRARWPLPVELALRLVSHLGLLPTNLALWGAWWLAGWRAPSDNPLGPAAPALGLAAVWTVCRLTKAWVRLPRPHAVIDGARLVGRVPSGSSFPSSHAALAFYTAGVAAHLGDRAVLTLVAYAVAALVCYVRVHIGAHYPRDVLVGACIGLAGALAVLLATG